MKWQNTLIVLAHPSKDGITAKLANIMYDELTNRGKKCTIIDLYNEPRLDFLDNDNPQEKVEYYQSLVKEASDVVFAYPTWWLSYPAILKNWIDHVFAARFAYKYHNKTLWYKVTGLPHGQLNNTRAHIITTSDMPNWKWIVLLFTPTLLIRSGFWFFCGMKQGRIRIFGNIFKRTPEQREIMINNFRKTFARDIGN
jgi:NAD(P)H dehydrogenase (quinone)